MKSIFFYMCDCDLIQKIAPSKMKVSIIKCTQLWELPNKCLHATGTLRALLEVLAHRADLRGEQFGFVSPTDVQVTLHRLDNCRHGIRYTYIYWHAFFASNNMSTEALYVFVQKASSHYCEHVCLMRAHCFAILRITYTPRPSDDTKNHI